MELKEYWLILQKYRDLFAIIVATTIILFLVYFFLRPVYFDASLTINITRSGIQETSDYQYDSFYRLQADEKFADTLVQWLKSPSVVTNIYRKAGLVYPKSNLRKLSKRLKADRVSPQSIIVTYSSPDQKSAEQLSKSIKQEITENIQSLNTQQKQENWFKIIVLDPVIIAHSVSIFWILGISLLSGFFLGFWTVLIVFYLK
jgi:capsular polysaccharide biosynthesis protein